MVNQKITIIDVVSGNVEIREMTVEEIKQYAPVDEEVSSEE